MFPNGHVICAARSADSCLVSTVCPRRGFEQTPHHCNVNGIQDVYSNASWLAVVDSSIPNLRVTRFHIFEMKKKTKIHLLKSNGQNCGKRSGMYMEVQLRPIAFQNIIKWVHQRPWVIQQPIYPFLCFLKFEKMEHSSR